MKVGKVSISSSVGQLVEAVLGRADPLAADLDHLAVPDVGVERAAADPVARFGDLHRGAPGDEGARGREPGEPGAGDDDVSIRHELPTVSSACDLRSATLYRAETVVTRWFC